VFRKLVLAGANTGLVADLIQRNGLSHGLVRRFVAGETLEAAIEVTRQLNTQGLTVSLDLLGENVAQVEEVAAAVANYSAILERIAATQVEANISVKLTMLGLDQGLELAHDSMAALLALAERHNIFVRIDMEGSAYTDQTMQLFERLHNRFSQHVGVVIQSYLRRARADVERMLERRARVRLVKGAYAEPPEVAFQSRREVDQSYIELMELLLERGNYPALATHDPALIAHAHAYTQRHKIAPERYEFQMLYGVRREAQLSIRRSGYNMRVYVPFGAQWYPYFTRRIAERPANALFVLRQLLP
jgi:proline dehydrogenase